MGLQISIIRLFKHDSPCICNTISRLDKHASTSLPTRAIPTKFIIATFGAHIWRVLPCQASRTTACSARVKLVSSQSNTALLLGTFWGAESEQDAAEGTCSEFRLSFHSFLSRAFRLFGLLGTSPNIWLPLRNL
jgi:hypothetical protein